MNRSGRVLPTLALIVSFHFFPGNAVARAPGADAPRQASEHFKAAVALVQRQAYQEAVRELEIAYELSPHPLVLYNLGQALVAAGDRSRAFQVLTQAAKDARLGDEARNGARADLEKLRGEIGLLRLVVAPKSARVSIDGKPAGPEVDGQLPLAAGTHQLLADADGHESTALEFVVDGGTSLAFNILLKQRLEAPPGWLIARCTVPGTVVSVDATSSDGTSFHPTLGAKIPLPVGPHVVVFTRRGYEAHAAPVRISPDTVTEISCKLRPQPTAPAVAAAGDADSWRNWSYGLGAVGLASAAASVVWFAVNQSQYDTWTTAQGALDTRWMASPRDTSVGSDQAINDSLGRKIDDFDKATIGFGIVGATLLGVAALIYPWGASAGDAENPSSRARSTAGWLRVGIRGSSAGIGAQW